MSTNLNNDQTEKTVIPNEKKGKIIFPTREDEARIQAYNYYEKLFLGEHFDAFNLKVDSVNFNEKYDKIRYVMVNFAGMISKIVADLLFGEEPKIKAGEDGDQEFIDALVRDNNLHVLLYESSLSNSPLGDDAFKVRVGKRNPSDKKPTIIIESITPKIYFPKLDPFNAKGEPSVVELAWVFTQNDKNYLRKEIHEAGKITNEVYLYEGKEVKQQVNLSILGIDGLLEVQETGISRKLTVHIPNWRFGNSHFGLSDYKDLDNLFFAVNNRMTMIDNILDKHSDPILMVPNGVLDEDGKVKKKALGVIEVAEGETGKPEYIIWDASLENAFKEIEKMIEFLYMTGEVSPDVLGLGEGVNDSGKALKFKLIRTLAKVNRKKLYYTRGIKEIFMIAQELAKKYQIEVGGVKLKGEPTEVMIDWADGLPIDISEQIETETKAIDVGITTKKAAAQRVYNINEEEAEALIKEKDDENKLAMPTMALGNKFAGDNEEVKPPIKKPVSK